MYRGLRVAVVIPAFNEERLVGQTVAGLPAWVDHLVLVDDGSTDRTAQAARDAAPERAGFEIHRHSENRGVGAAIGTGYLRCRELAVELAVVVGADAQMDPADLPALLDPVVEGRADYAKGNRLAWPGVRRQMPRLRWLGNWGLTWLTRWVSGYPGVTDSQCGYTALRGAALALLPLAEIYPRYGYPNDLLARAHCAGLRVCDVPVRPIYGSEVSGIHEIGIIGPMLRLLWRIWRRRRSEERALRRVRGALPPRAVELPQTGGSQDGGW